MNEEGTSKNKKFIRIFLIVNTVIFALAIIPGVIAAVFSVMIFDSGVTNYLVVLYSFISTFPLICFLSFFSWLFYRFGKLGLALFISLLPVLNIIGIFLVFVIRELI